MHGLQATTEHSKGGWPHWEIWGKEVVFVRGINALEKNYLCDRTKIVVGGRKIKQLDLQILGYEGFGTGVFACFMRQFLFMQRSNKTASTGIVDRFW